jgi:hypothetical protein
MTIDRRLIDSLVHAAFTLRSREHEVGEPTPTAPLPGPPASAAELKVLEAYLRERALRLPPSYRTFLKLCNGVKNFRPEPFSELSLLSIKEVMRHPHRSHLKRYPTLSRFQIARGESLEFIAIDAEHVHAGEPEVAWVTAEGDEVRYRSFEGLLKARLKSLRGALKGDR